MCECVCVCVCVPSRLPVWVLLTLVYVFVDGSNMYVYGYVCVCMQAGKEKLKVQAHKKAINDIQFSKDQTMFVTASADHTCKVIFYALFLFIIKFIVLQSHNYYIKNNIQIVSLSLSLCHSFLSI